MGCAAQTNPPGEARAEQLASPPASTPTDLPASASTPEPEAISTAAETVAEAGETATPIPQPTAISTSTSTLTPASPPPEAGPTSTSEPPITTADDADPDLAAYGLQVYKQQYCGICHQLDAAATKGIFGPSQNGIGITSAERIRDPNYSGQATTAADYIRESILKPDIYFVEGYAQNRHPMPAFTHLSDEEVEALVQFLLQQK